MQNNYIPQRSFEFESTNFLGQGNATGMADRDEKQNPLENEPNEKKAGLTLDKNRSSKNEAPWQKTVNAERSRGSGS